MMKRCEEETREKKIIKENENQTLSDPAKKEPVLQRNVKFSRKASENFKLAT